MLWDVPCPKIKVGIAFRIPFRSLVTRLFLDYLMVLTESMDLSILSKATGTFKFYPKYYNKTLPTKYLDSFPVSGHSFYVGKYEDLDLFIVAKPNVDVECNCAELVKDRGGSGCVSEEIAAIIGEDVVLKSLSKMDPLILNGKNVTISESYENFTTNNYSEFQVNDFDDAFKDHFKSAWSRIDHDFFKTHSPLLLFTRYGQNILVNQEVFQFNRRLTLQI
jgi:hypothetical protein